VGRMARVVGRARQRMKGGENDSTSHVRSTPQRPLRFFPLPHGRVLRNCLALVFENAETIVPELGTISRTGAPPLHVCAKMSVECRPEMSLTSFAFVGSGRGPRQGAKKRELAERNRLSRKR
jgi:hypothetical protein